jgi:hypothetical protein
MKTLFLITGAPRSGTTWLNRELCLLKSAFPFIPECTLITEQVKLFHNIIHYCDKNRFEGYFGTKDKALKYFQKNIREMLKLVSKINYQNGSTKLILKDPSLALYLDDCRDLFPNHKLIIIIRDPRDVLASLKKVFYRKSQAFEIKEQNKFIYNYYYRIGKFAQKNTKNTFFVKYENLVSSYAEREIFFLKIGMVEKNKDITNIKKSFISNIFNSRYKIIKKKIEKRDPFYTELYFKDTTDKSVGSYKEILTTKERYQVEIDFHSVLSKYNYLN